MMNNKTVRKMYMFKCFVVVLCSFYSIMVINAMSLVSSANEPSNDVIHVAQVVDDNLKTETKKIPKFEVVDSSKVDIIQQPKQIIDNGNQVYAVPEKMPSYPGGEAALLKYISYNVRYPVIAMENGIQGRVICRFIVERDGSVSEVEVVRSVHQSLDSEAVRVLKMMPLWTPGMNDNQAIRVYYTLPINFKLQTKTNSKQFPTFDRNNPPIIVLDGIELSSDFNLSRLDPKTIETIDVLKTGCSNKDLWKKGKEWCNSNYK